MSRGCSHFIALPCFCILAGKVLYSHLTLSLPPQLAYQLVPFPRVHFWLLSLLACQHYCWKEHFSAVVYMWGHGDNCWDFSGIRFLPSSCCLYQCPEWHPQTCDTDCLLSAPCLQPDLKKLRKIVPRATHEFPVLLPLQWSLVIYFKIHVPNFEFLPWHQYFL